MLQLEAKIAPTPKDTIYREGKGSIYRFRGGKNDGTHVPVLLVPSMINRWYVLDLREGASVATAVSVGAPYDTFLFDWGIPEDEDRFLSWDDVVAKLDRVVKRVLRITGASKVAIVGYCMGATLSSIYTALHPERVAALVNLAGPIDFSHAGRLGTMVDKRWFDPEAYVLKTALTRGVAMHVTGSVELELRRGDDYTILDTQAEAATYDMHKLSMERSETMFTPEDRIGALEMQTLSVLDGRSLMLHLEKARAKGDELSIDVDLT